MNTSTLPKPIPKASTGITGLDQVLHGGLPVGRTTLISGGPGAGKTILALQVLYGRAQAGDPCVFMACEERVEVLRQHALSMGWDLEALEKKGMLVMIPAELDADMVLTGEVNLKGLLAIVEAQMRALDGKYLVIDGIDVLLRVFDDPRRERNELHMIHKAMQRLNATVLITNKLYSASGHQHHDWLEFMADCVLLLDHRVTDQVSTRRLRVLKYRGSPSGRNEYPYVIGRGGFRLVPVSSGNLSFDAPGERMSSGSDGLDAMLGGGIMRRSSMMICGCSGSGKTILSASIAAAAAARGERTLFISFEESKESLLDHLRNVGIDLKDPVEEGILQMLSVLPESCGVEEHLIRIIDALDEYRPEHIVVDAITASRRMGTQHAAFDFAIRVLSICRERSLTCIFTNQVGGKDDETDVTGTSLSSLVDLLILLRNVHVEERTERLIAVLKCRGTGHSTARHAFTISDKGISIGDPPKWLSTKLISAVDPMETNEQNGL